MNYFATANGYEFVYLKTYFSSICKKKKYYFNLLILKEELYILFNCDIVNYN